MRTTLLAACLLVAGLWVRGAQADIYSWVDDDGVRHISNVNPPPGAEVFLRTPAAPSPALAGKARAQRATSTFEEDLRARENERLREHRTALGDRLAETEEKVEAAQRALERAQERLVAARARYESDRRFAGSLVYGTRIVVTPRHDRFRRHKPSHVKHARGSIFLDRPFRLGAITIPLFNARDHFRKPQRRWDPEKHRRPVNGKPHLKRRRGGDRRHR